MSATTKRRPKFSAEQLAAYRDAKRTEQRDRLEAAVRELLTSEGWTRFVQTRAKFHRYSRHNVMLIASQMPEATQVAGFRKWQELGRQVRKGERGLMILAPSTKKIEDPDTGEETQRLYFRGVSVFDISQTDGDALPEPPKGEPVTGDSHAEFLPRLLAFAQEQGLAVEMRSLPEGGARGWWDPKEKLIVVSADLAANSQVRTLVHELAHAIGDVTYQRYGREAAEVIAESASFIACSAIGLDTGGEAIPYVTAWGDEATPERIGEFAETVDTIARDLEGACGEVAA